MQNIKKKLICQFWEKCCINELMDKLGYSGPFDPISGKYKFSKKKLDVSLEY